MKVEQEKELQCREIWQAYMRRDDAKRGNQQPFKKLAGKKNSLRMILPTEEG